MANTPGVMDDSGRAGIVEGSLIVSQQRRLQSTQFINGVYRGSHPVLLSDWCYYNNTSVIHCAPGSALIKPSLWHQIQMIFYSVVNLRRLSPFVGVCYERVSWEPPTPSVRFPTCLLTTVLLAPAPCPFPASRGLAVWLLPYPGSSI